MLTFSFLSFSGGLGGILISALHAFWAFGVPCALASSHFQVLTLVLKHVFPPARFRRICPDRRAVLALCCRFTSAVEVVAVDGSATQPLFHRLLRPLSFCGTTVSPLLRRHRRTPLGGRGAWRSGPSSSSLLLFPSLMVGEHSDGFDRDRISTPGKTTNKEIYFRR